MILSKTIEQNLKYIEEGITKAQAASPISAQDITLLAASKTQDINRIEEAIYAGIINLGENRVQEAMEKWQAGQLKEKHPHIKLHLIGALQTNKVKQALQLFDVIQTLDRPSLADEIAKELRKLGIEETRKEKHPNSRFLNSTIPNFQIPDFYIQINTGAEPQKAGILPENADEFIKYCTKELHLPIIGLMCIPPADQPPAPHFALLRQIAGKYNLKDLSMGMSNDFDVAIRMGATCIRLGSALFGERI